MRARLRTVGVMAIMAMPFAFAFAAARADSAHAGERAMPPRGAFVGLVGSAFARDRTDCSAAVRRVLSQRRGELIGVRVVNGSQGVVCRVTMLVSERSGQRRRRETHEVRP